MVRVLFEFIRRQAQQSFFDLERRFPPGNPGSIRHPKYMRIDRDRWFPKGGVQNDVRRLAADAR